MLHDVPPDAHAALLAVSTRNDVVECRFRGAVAALDGGGVLRVALGRPEVPVYGRSANKPMQAQAMVELGLDVPEDLLALVCSSHSGEPRHLDGVRRLLSMHGLGEEDLGCAVFAPIGEQARADMAWRGEAATRLTSDCSGKHAGMLATCVVNHWPRRADYLRTDHPLQQAITAAIARLSGEQPAFIGTDGCGAPAHGLSLAGLARAYASIAQAGGAVHRAMTAHPQLVGGTGRGVTLLMEAMPGLLAKDGADGVFAAALPDGRAVAVKIADGAAAPRLPVTLAALAVLGVEVGPAADLREVPVLGGGHPVGSLHAVLPD